MNENLSLFNLVVLTSYSELGFSFDLSISGFKILPFFLGGWIIIELEQQKSTFAHPHIV